MEFSVEYPILSKTSKGGVGMEHTSASYRVYRTSGRSAARRNRGNQSGLSPKERVRLVQLCVCLVLFLAVFVGKGAFPQQLAQIQNKLVSALTADTDFRAAFSKLGESLGTQDSVLGELEDFCVEVFGIQPSGAGDDLEGQSQTQQEQAFLNAGASSADLAAHYLRLEDMPQDWLSGGDAVSETPETAPEPQAQAQPEAAAAQPEETVPAVGTVLLSANYEGPALPNNYTMDKLSLGALETVNPILGHLNSVYGYRDHPVDGEYKFHNGVDIGGQMGAPIGAFAAGTVEYIGENDDHGLYLQIDHGNGVKSFYAHCSKLCVSQGQTVATGETVALVGSTGVSTGPHLHLEIKCNGVHVDPAYYVTFLTD